MNPINPWEKPKEEKPLSETGAQYHEIDSKTGEFYRPATGDRTTPTKMEKAEITALQQLTGEETKKLINRFNKHMDDPKIRKEEFGHLDGAALTVYEDSTRKKIAQEILAERIESQDLKRAA